MNAGRLLLVAKALREAERPQRFYMGRISTCGTAHCAFAHYVARRDLQQLYSLPSADYCELRDLSGLAFSNVVLKGAWGATRPIVEWRKEIGIHFELSGSQVELIFGPEGCGGAATAEQAAEFIEQFVARWSMQQLNKES